METSKPVVVKHVPEKVGLKEARAFFREMQPILTVDRPQIVFDLSGVKQIDAAGVEMLLECMAEVMKRDGDLKLAGLSPHAEVILEVTRTDRLFEIYQNSADAVRSFTRYIPSAMRRQPFAVIPEPTSGGPATVQTEPATETAAKVDSSDAAA
jgi:anti-sigma B factor antagonist